METPTIQIHPPIMLINRAPSRRELRNLRSWVSMAVLLLILGTPTGHAQTGDEELLEIQTRAYQADANAQNTLGNAYTNGDLGLNRDFVEAFKWYSRAAEQGFPQALFNLGLAFELGRGVPAEAGVAFKYYLRAAEKGYATAQFNVANMYSTGRGVPQDSFEAVLWYRQAAEQKLAEAQFNLGLAYESGNGVTKDEALAAQWYESAAAQNFPLAQYNLGILLEDGRGVEKDEIAAATLYRSAAEHGIAPAQNNYGLMLFEGRGGLPPDPVEAFVWLNLAVENGVPPAARDAIAKELSPEQLSAAKLWLKQHHTAQIQPISKGQTTPINAQTSAPDAIRYQQEAAALRNKNDQLEKWVQSLEQALNKEPKDTSTPILERFGLEPRQYSRNDELQKEISRLRQELDDTRKQLAENGVKLDALRTENERLQARDRGDSSDTTALRSNLLEAQYAARELQQDKDRLVLNTTELKSSLEAREAELAALREQAGQADARLMEASTADRERLANLQTQLQQAKAELSSTQTAFMRLAEKHRSQEIENTALLARQQAENADLLTRLTRAQDQLNQNGPVRVAPPVAALAAEPTAQTARIHIVEQGDSLSKISERYYGTRSRWEEIYRANGTALRGQQVLRVGQRLVIP
jgi:TPR repeat protein/LysM repeat protein